MSCGWDPQAKVARNHLHHCIQKMVNGGLTKSTVIKKLFSMSDWVSPEFANRVADSIADHMTICVVPLPLFLVPCITESSLHWNGVELEITGVVNLTGTSEERSIHVLEVMRTWSKAGVEVMSIFARGLEEVFGSAARHVAVFDYLTGLGGAFVAMVLALRVTVLCNHEMNLCTVWISLSFIIASSVCPRWSSEFSANVSQMSVTSNLSVRCQSMWETQCQILHKRDSMSQTQYLRLIVRDLVFATGAGNMPAVRVWTGKTVRFGSWRFQNLELLPLGSPNPDPYPSTGRFRRVWQDPLAPVFGSAFRVVLCMVAFRYCAVNHKISTMVCHCFLWMYWQPLKSITGEACSLSHPGNEHQWSVNDVWCYIFGNLSGDCVQIVITDVLASCKGQRGSDTLPAPSWKWASTEFQWFKVWHLQ